MVPMTRFVVLISYIGGPVRCCAVGGMFWVHCVFETVGAHNTSLLMVMSPVPNCSLDGLVAEFLQGTGSDLLAPEPFW